MTEKQIDQAIAEFTAKQRPYCSNLDAMHEAETVMLKEIPHHDAMLYDNMLDECTCGFPWHSTAAQRAEALLRTIGKWKD